MAESTSNPLLASSLGDDEPKTGAKLMSSTLSWRNISFEVPEKRILKDINGSVEPGRLLCIMGPSGAGKSTMLNLLAGRLGSGGTVSGDLLSDSNVIDPTTFRSKIAYVMQEDALFATQTPREALEFSAALRLPKRFTAQERTALVEDMLDELGLIKCADTYVGSVMLRGVSGGEKKRTAIGVELISQPEILFLDEPTSGLDSYAAYNVVKLLGELAQCGVTIVCTIHQPSSEVFALFDDCMLLADGRLVYHGTRRAMLPYFSSIGFDCQPNYNPADFVMFLMQEDASGQGSTESLAAHAEHLSLLWTDRTKQDPESGVSEHTPTSTARRNTKSSNYMDRLAHLSSGDNSKHGTWYQFGWLVQREGRNVLRNKGALYAMVGVTITLNLIIGLVFKGAGKWSDSTEPVELAASITDHSSALTQVAIGAMFGLAQPALLAFPLERPVFLRESATGVYASWPYFFSKCLCEIPIALLQSSLMMAVTYWTIGFQGNALYMILTCALTGMTAASTSLIVGSVVENVQTAIQATPLLFVPQLLFSGLFIPVSKIPVFMRWAQYLCSLKYGVNLLFIVEFADPPGNDLYSNGIYGHNQHSDVCSNPKVCQAALFPRNDVNADDRWMYVGILMGIFWCFRITSAILLTLRARN